MKAHKPTKWEEYEDVINTHLHMTPPPLDPRLKLDGHGNVRVRTFDTGATRDTDEGKIDYEGHIDPYVLEEYGRYMNKHRIQSDGTQRASDNWQKGIPSEQYVKSALRHVIDAWKEWRGKGRSEVLLDLSSAILFNVMGLMHNLIKDGGLREERQPKI